MTSPPRESWEGLTARRDRPAAPPIDATTPDTDEEMVMRALTTTAGRALLEFLKRETIFKAQRADVSDAMLRWDAGQRALVQRLETMIERGQEIAKARSAANAAKTAKVDNG